MQWSNGRLFGRPAILDRLMLRRAALRYAAHGWAVVPGACFTGRRFACDQPGCPIAGCHPAIESWEDDASTDPAQVAHWWRHRPHTVLLATGWTFDVLEVPAVLGLRALGTARLQAGLLGPERVGAHGPVAVSPEARWMFLVRPGAALRPELARRLDVVHHGRGSWIPAAPSRAPGGPARWAVSPEQVHWHLPEPEAVQGMLIGALGTGARRRVPAGSLHRRAVPRQVSTARRAA